MKKLMFAAVAIAAGIAFADQAITSANIVGYVNTAQITANKVDLGSAPFETVGSELIDIQSMITTKIAPVPFSESDTKAVQIQVWNGVNGYEIYYYVSDAYVEEDDDEVTGWADGLGDYVDAQIAPGTGYWYKYPPAASDYTMPGQVITAESVTKDVYNTKLNLIGNPYPIALDLEKVTTTVAAVPFSESDTKAVQIQVWNGVNGYEIYYYVSDAYVEEDDDEVTGWADGLGDYVVETSAAIGAGMWVKSPASNGTITFWTTKQK